MSNSEMSVRSVTAKILFQLDETREVSSTKGMLANIRNSVGKRIEEATGVWPILFENLPEEFLSSYKEPRYEEVAILTAIQLFALHQQGKSESVWDKESKRANIGTALGKLRTGESKSTDDRFNAMITSITFDELAYHLRQMIKLLSSKSDVKVNYPGLAEDLYWFLKGSDNIRLNWSREYYKQFKKDEKEGEDKNEK